MIENSSSKSLPILSEILETPEKELKFCSKCSFLLGNRNFIEYWEDWRCNKFREPNGFNLVTGEEIFPESYCKDLRNSDTTCGPEGKWYEEYIKPDIYNRKIGENEDSEIETPVINHRISKRKLTENDLQNL